MSVRQWKGIGYDGLIRWGPVTGWLEIAGKPASGPEHFIDFVPNLTEFALELNTGHVVSVVNPPILSPSILIGAGGWSSAGWAPQGATLINEGLAEWETATAPGLQAQRLNDTDTRKRFLVNLV